MTNKPLTYAIGAFLILSAIFVFGIMPAVDNNFSQNPEAAHSYAESSPSFINTIVDGLLNVSGVAPWAPGIIVFGGAILLIVAGYKFLGKLLHV
ncbi:hypothetical protein A2X44_00840 [candidate division CPR3 bacterium GWF2_35_18]|uniref:PDGLE domain-containing protein n=1 Tax=candidate division CPR3 bacterium GW2011_GWF2_35_18 TaxID=1618350 RepID=A0A0G0BL74_UNCC3|nr:MAG: hypothetical protein UR67_C0001G0148 [candidate division CPR3 bacterium GW2011_GWF2_35_18]OGB63452.1 MAG: hypothetical protein A2X44_00840 [candidate division CPR3 bacterium GWF2_35_18]OGB64802.1 MAG: hypothetical protein A2250_05185 [candidate division CPR3 bacterium RIFOXYA2_FULL_35_13]OGB77192.1 MAG: hypothetical protein A2476_03735 [candidate division CPR3 bacterium RIFOXYC2_FULL_35_7]OGB78570.1 MAG: hypothetical protein A2296_01445 [candidate division CPR3 bacterium RIFOXYB2_FULL_3